MVSSESIYQEWHETVYLCSTAAYGMWQWDVPLPLPLFPPCQTSLYPATNVNTDSLLSLATASQWMPRKGLLAEQISGRVNRVWSWWNPSRVPGWKAKLHVPVLEMKLECFNVTNLMHCCWCRAVHLTAPAYGHLHLDLLASLTLIGNAIFTSCSLNQSVNQSKFIFWAIEILQCIQCMLALKRLPEKHTLIKLAAQTNKRTQILIQTGRGKRQGGTNNDMCSASGNTVLINLNSLNK